MVIEGNVVIKGWMMIGVDCLIGVGLWIEDSILYDDVIIMFLILERLEVYFGVDVGLNSYLCLEVELGENVYVGNFCEVKKVYIGVGIKVGYLFYIGDVILGKNINVGCGVVFVNYDGINKFYINVGDYVFIGFNFNIVVLVNIVVDFFVVVGFIIMDSIE